MPQPRVPREVVVELQTPQNGLGQRVERIQARTARGTTLATGHVTPMLNAVQHVLPGESCDCRGEAQRPPAAHERILPERRLVETDIERPVRLVVIDVVEQQVLDLVGASSKHNPSLAENVEQKLQISLDVLG